MVIRDDIIEEIKEIVFNYEYVSWLQHVQQVEDISAESDKIKKLFEQATLDQLWSLLKLLKRNPKIRFLNCAPSDHVAVQMAGMYVGIEPDGYTHS